MIYAANTMVARIKSSSPRRLFLREWREHRGLTQEQLATALSTDKGTISKWENAKRATNTDILFEIANALRCGPGDLFQDPAVPSTDSLLREAPPDMKQQAIAIIAALVNHKR